MNFGFGVRCGRPFVRAPMATMSRERPSPKICWNCATSKARIEAKQKVVLRTIMNCARLIRTRRWLTGALFDDVDQSRMSALGDALPELPSRAYCK